MLRGRVILATSGLDPKKTARYLQYRAYLHDPLVVATDHGGEWSHHSRCGPDSYQLSILDGIVQVVVKGSSIELKWRGEPAKALCDRLVQDPIWGPDWLAPARTRG